MAKQIILPPGIGADLDVPYLYNPYIHDPEKGFMAALRTRVCLTCKTVGRHNSEGIFICPGCGFHHTSNLTAPRAFNRLLLLAGRGGGKTLAGAHAVREEAMIPNSIIWVMGPNFKVLHDSTFPTLVRLLDPRWIKYWSQEHAEIILHNNTKIAFRSLDDPERARGPHGVTCGWFDEAAQSPERAYDVFVPTLLKAGGIVLATTTVMGYDWTYDRIEKQAQVHKRPGYWSCKFWTEENPQFRVTPTAMLQIERDKLEMAPDFYAQEYKAERRNAQGLVYDFSLIEKQCLMTDAEVKRVIPEWPAISPSRQILIGLDSGANHPFGAAKLVVTEQGIVVVADYLERLKAVSQHLAPMAMQFGVGGNPNVTWAGNKNELNLRLEFALKGISVVPAENKHEVGIQRVQSWLYTQKLFFAYTVPRTIEQMRTYRYANNLKPSGEKKAKEDVFKEKDELPDAVRYAIMAWPELPTRTEPLMSESEQSRWAAFDDKTRADITRMKEYDQREADKDLEQDNEHYPMGSFFGSTDQW